MTSPSPYKLILTIDEINYRIPYNVSSTANSSGGCLSFKQLAQLIEQDDRQFKDLNIFDQTKYIIEIYDKDFKDYVKLEENFTIDNLSRLRVIPFSGKISLNTSIGSSKGLFNETFTTNKSCVTPSLEKVTSNKDTSNDLMINDGTEVAASKSDSSASALAAPPTPVASGKSCKVKKKKDKIGKESPIVELSFKRCYDETNEEAITSDGGSRKKIQIGANKTPNKSNKTEAAAVADMSKKTSNYPKSLVDPATFPKVVNMNNGQSTGALIDLDNLCKDFKFNFAIDRSLASNPFSPPNSSKTMVEVVKSNKEDKVSSPSSKKSASATLVNAKSAKTDKESKTPNKPPKATPANLGSNGGDNTTKEKKKKKGKVVAQASDIFLKQSSNELSGFNRETIHSGLHSTSATSSAASAFVKNAPPPRNGEGKLDQSLDDEYDSSHELEKTFSSRLIIDDYGRKQLTERDFILSNLEEKKKFIEIFTTYVRMFSALDRGEDAWKADDIWKEISSDLKKVNINIDPKAEFAQLLGQYIDIITHLCDWTEQECNKLWPLFLKFHYELTLTPFTKNIDKVIKEFESHPKKNPDQKLGGAIQERPDNKKNRLRQARSSNAYHDYSYESKPFNGVLTVIGKKPLMAQEFEIDNFEEKQLVVEALVEVMGTMSKSQMKAEAAIWSNVSQRLDTIFLNLSPKKCRKHFNSLLEQYKSILKNLIEWKPEDCQKLWPFFNVFHFTIDFSILQEPVQKAKKKFNERAKKDFNFSGQHEPQQHETRQNRPTSSSHCSDITESYHEEVGKKETKLVDAVFHNIEFMDKFSEDYFWQRIAYDMGAWSPPLQDSSRAKWKRLFHNLLNSYENELNNQTRGKLSQLFAGRDITPFLGKSETKKDKKMKEQNENASAKKTPKSVLKRPTAPSALEAITSLASSTPTITSYAAATAANTGKPKSNITPAGNYCHTDSDILADQLLLVTIFADRLKKSEINPDFWQLLSQDLKDAGKSVNPQTSLEDYFTRLSRIQLETMKISKSIIDAVKTWPLFKILNDLDLSYFFEDKWTYRQLKSNFQ